MSPNLITHSLDKILGQYKNSFTAKVFAAESVEVDDLMLVFGLTQAVKMSHRQYWGRELGMCWQRLLAELFRQSSEPFSGPIRAGADELCDFVVGRNAIDTKYRMGSGDSGTLKKFRLYAARLKAIRYDPLLLILRTDNLPQAIAACASGGWDIKIGQSAYHYVAETTGFDLQAWLKSMKNQYAM
ncbi:MAG: restriction endonuclease [Chloroflexi bacterium]|nr:restriction endonuclease [Chloroflexota bacterium]MBI3734494.1 restriction endonuclease [Chloroflexota bacterium]